MDSNEYLTIQEAVALLATARGISITEDALRQRCQRESFGQSQIKRGKIWYIAKDAIMDFEFKKSFRYQKEKESDLYQKTLLIIKAWIDGTPIKTIARDVGLGHEKVVWILKEIHKTVDRISHTQNL